MDWSKGEVSRIKTRLSLYCVRWSADAPHESRINVEFGGVIFRSTKGIRFCKQEESARTKAEGSRRSLQSLRRWLATANPHRTKIWGKMTAGLRELGQGRRGFLGELSLLRLRRFVTRPAGQEIKHRYDSRSS